MVDRDKERVPVPGSSRKKIPTKIGKQYSICFHHHHNERIKMRYSTINERVSQASECFLANITNRKMENNARIYEGIGILFAYCMANRAFCSIQLGMLLPLVRVPCIYLVYLLSIRTTWICPWIDFFLSLSLSLSSSPSGPSVSIYTRTWLRFLLLIFSITLEICSSLFECA